MAVLKTPLKFNSVTDQKLEAADLYRNKYTYRQVFCFKFFRCFRRQDKAYKKYLQHKAIISDRLDVKNIISNEANLITLSSILLKPYQIKLI